jgi:hypothetical protein
MKPIEVTQEEVVTATIYTVKTSGTQKIVENFTARGESYKAGMLLLIKYLTTQNWKISEDSSTQTQLRVEKIEAIYRNYCESLKVVSTFADAKKCFDDLLTNYEDILRKYTTLKEPHQDLLDAERCHVWQQGRETLETRVDLHVVSGDGKTVIQRETPIAGGDLRVQEYKKINTDCPPYWFQLLPPWRQNFIKDHWQALCQKSIPSSLRDIPGLANLSVHDCYVGDEKVSSHVRSGTIVPVDLLRLKQDKHALREALRLSVLNQVDQITTSLNQQLVKQSSDSDQESSEVFILTQSLLSPGIAADIKAKCFSNASDNDTQIYEVKERVVEFFQQALSEPHASINDAEIKALFFNEEEGKSACYKDFLAKYGLIVQRKGLIYKGHFFAKIILASTNHPTNSLRRLGVHPRQTVRNDHNTALLLGVVGCYLSRQNSLLARKIRHGQNPKLLTHTLNQECLHDLLKSLSARLNSGGVEKKVSVSNREGLIKILEDLLQDADVKQILDQDTLRLLNALQVLLIVPHRQASLNADERNCQLLLSAAEAILCNCIGATPYIACKSGKDRTGVASAAIDGAAIHYEQSGKFPHHKDSEADRVNYLQVFKAFWESGHHQQVASANAPGAQGLLNPSMPSDMRLDTDEVKLETKLAGLNKPKKPLGKRNRDVLNEQPFKEALKELTDEMNNGTVSSDTPVLFDWERNKKLYFIGGTSVHDLRKGAEFRNEEELSTFIEERLLYKIKDKHLKEYCLKAFFSTFHQGGFQHLCSRVSVVLINGQGDGQRNLYKPPEAKIDFFPLKNGIELRESSAYKAIKDEEGCEIPPKKGSYYCQINSSISITASQAENAACKLDAVINDLRIDCPDPQLKLLFFLENRSFLALFEKMFEQLRGNWLIFVQFFKGIFLQKDAGQLPVDSNSTVRDRIELPVAERESGSMSVVPTQAVPQISAVERLIIKDEQLKKLLKVATHLLQIYSPRDSESEKSHRPFCAWKKPVERLPGGMMFFNRKQLASNENTQRLERDCSVFSGTRLVVNR